MIATIMRRMMIAMHIHFLEFLCKLFAFWRAVFPDCTWSTADETWDITVAKEFRSITLLQSYSLGRRKGNGRLFVKIYLRLYVIKHVSLSIHEHRHVHEYLHNTIECNNKNSFFMYQSVNFTFKLCNPVPSQNKLIDEGWDWYYLSIWKWSFSKRPSISD